MADFCNANTLATCVCTQRKSPRDRKIMRSPDQSLGRVQVNRQAAWSYVRRLNGRVDFRTALENSGHRQPLPTHGYVERGGYARQPERATRRQRCKAARRHGDSCPRRRSSTVLIHARALESVFVSSVETAGSGPRRRAPSLPPRNRRRGPIASATVVSPSLSAQLPARRDREHFFPRRRSARFESRNCQASNGRGFRARTGNFHAADGGRS